MSENALIAQWNKMTPNARYFAMVDELSKRISDDDYVPKNWVEDNAKLCMKQKFSELPRGLQRHALRALSPAYAMQEDYKNEWIPDRNVQYGKYPVKSRIYIGDYVLVHPHAQLTNTKTVGDVYGPRGTYGRVVGIRMNHEDAVDSVATVYLGNGKRGAFYYNALEKVTKQRLGYAKWQALLATMIGEEIHDIADERYS